MGYTQTGVRIYSFIHSTSIYLNHLHPVQSGPAGVSATKNPGSDGYLLHSLRPNVSVSSVNGNDDRQTTSGRRKGRHSSQVIASHAFPLLFMHSVSIISSGRLFR
jgi:hypothetical protein